MWGIDYSTRMNTIYVIYHEHILLTFENYTKKFIWHGKGFLSIIYFPRVSKAFNTHKNWFCYLSQENRLIRIYNNINVEHKDEMIA